MADDHSAFSCAQDPASPTRRAWPYGGAARHSPESCRDQLPICSARSIVVSCRTARRKIYYIIDRPTRSFLSSRKEGRARLHRASGSWKGGPRISADLVNRPQDFPLGFRGDGRRCSVRSFNVRTSLFVGPRLWSSFLKEFRAPCRAVMLGSQLAILVQGRGETSRPVRQLSRRFLPDRMLDQ